MSDTGDPWGTPPGEGDGSGEPPRPQLPPEAPQPTWAQPPGPAQQPAQQPAWGQPQQPGQPGGGAPQPPGAPSYPSYPPPQGYGYGPQQPAWGAQPYYGPQTSGKATTVLVLGIVSLVLLFSCIGFIPAIVALVLARGAEREIAESGGRLTGEGQVKAGRIMSWVTIGLTVLGGLALALIFGLALSTGSSSDGGPTGGVSGVSAAGAVAFDLLAGAR